MKLIRGTYNLKYAIKNTVATIGNFDGVHLGHQKIIQQLIEIAERNESKTSLIIFEPQPQEYFSSHAKARLTKLSDKIAQLQDFSLAQVVILKFNLAFANMSAADFVTEILIQQLAIQHLLVGDDFHFGANRVGNYHFLGQYKTQFQLTKIQTFEYLQQRVSSTRIRDALDKGEMNFAKQLLGRYYRMSGRVQHGQKKGRTIGFPTLNLHIAAYHSTIQGVFAVLVNGLDKVPYHGVANIGTRPTLKGTYKLLEIHLFEFDKVVYGQSIQVDFLHKIRDEQRFSTFTVLKAQILKDKQIAINFFRNKTND